MKGGGSPTRRWPVLRESARMHRPTRLPSNPQSQACLAGSSIDSIRRKPGDSERTNAGLRSSAISQQPHMINRGRLKGQRGIPRRESSVLPRSNPFANPRPRLVDSVAPAVRFLTMVALFTAAGIWIQMMGRHEPQPTRSIEPPKTAAQPAAAPAKNADDHTVPVPTATGPIETLPDTGARVGRAEGDDFATRRQFGRGSGSDRASDGDAATLFDFCRQPRTASASSGLKSDNGRRNSAQCATANSNSVSRASRPMTRSRTNRLKWPVTQAF